MYHYTLENLINLVKKFHMYVCRSVEDILQACSVPFSFSKSKLEYVLCLYYILLQFWKPVKDKGGSQTPS